MRERRNLAVVAIGVLSLLMVATAGSARPLHKQLRPAAQSETSLLWPFGKPEGALPSRRAAPRQLSAPVRRQPAARAVRPEPRVSRIAKVQRLQRHPTAHANYARVEIDEAKSGTDFGHGRASALVAEARRYLGTNPTGRASLWCARFMNFVLKRTGYPGTGSDAAKSFAYYGHRVSGPQYGAIAVLTRKGGGHVGIVTGVDRRGNPIILSGNNGRRKVGISVYPKRRVIAYVVPDGTTPSKRRIRQAMR